MKERHHISKQKRFTILLVSESDGAKSYSKSFTPTSITLSIIAVFVFIGSLTIAIFAYTPLGVFFPVPNALLEKKYGNELINLEQRLEKISSEFIYVQEYNLKLRQALGEDSTRKNFISNIPDLENQNSGLEVEEKQSASLVEDVKEQLNFSTSNFLYPKLPFSLPLGGLVTRDFNSGAQHFGIDFSGRRGAIISSVADGKVMFVGWTFEYGNTIIINHGDGYVSVYKHNQSLLKNLNQNVKRGEAIALLGDSGNTSVGVHLHFEIWKDGVAVDPKNLIIDEKIL